MDGTVDSAAASQCRIRGIDDDIDMFGRNVTDSHNYLSLLEVVNRSNIHLMCLYYEEECAGRGRRDRNDNSNQTNSFPNAGNKTLGPKET